MASAEQVISHYQRDIEKICSRPEKVVKYEDRLLHCLAKLNKIPITVKHLQDTGIGKTVNSLRKYGSRKGLSDAAKALVAKWKNAVLEEDDGDDDEAICEERVRNEDSKRIKLVDAKDHRKKEYSPDNGSNCDVDYKPSTSSSQGNNFYTPESISQPSKTDIKEYSPSKKSYTPNGYSPGSPNVNGIQVYCYSPSKKGEKNSYDPKKENKKIEKQQIDYGGGEKSSSLKSPSSRKEIDASQKLNKDKSSSSSSRGHSSSKHNSSSSSKESPKNSKLKKIKTHENTNVDEDGGINAMSGASFADALGPMVLKKDLGASKKKSKSSSRDVSSKKSIDSKSRRDSNKSSRQDHIASSSSKSSERKMKPTASASTLLDDVAGPSHLVPLDMDVVSTLSVPTPNYKPTPQIPLTSLERKQRIQAEEDALERIMSNRNKNSRTKVYSGVKGGLTYVPSLYEQCCNVLKQHIDALEYTGGIPFSLLKPVLEGASPTQLYQFEHYNSYMIGDTDELWYFHVNKEFRNKPREEMESWRDMYLRCVDEREEKYKAVTANIQESLKKSVPVRQTKLAYVDVAKPPRNIQRKQIKNGTTRPDVERLMGKEAAGGVVVKPPGRVGAAFERARVSTVFKPKVAPLMQKTLKSIKQIRFKR